MDGPSPVAIKQFRHWKSHITVDINNLLKGVIESVLISKGIIKGLNLLCNPRGYSVTTISVLLQSWSSSVYPRIE